MKGRLRQLKWAKFESPTKQLQCGCTSCATGTNAPSLRCIAVACVDFYQARSYFRKQFIICMHILEQNACRLPERLPMSHVGLEEITFEA